MWRAESDERRHHVDSTVVGYRCRDGVGFGGGFENPQLIAQPLHRRSSDEHTAFHGILRRR